MGFNSAFKGLSGSWPKWQLIAYKQSNAIARCFHYKHCTYIHIYLFIYLFILWRCDPTRVLASSFLRYLDHTQRRITVDRTSRDEWSARRRDLYLTTHNTHNRQTSMPPVIFEPNISVSERPQTYARPPEPALHVQVQSNSIIWSRAQHSCLPYTPPPPLNCSFTWKVPLKVKVITPVVLS